MRTIDIILVSYNSQKWLEKCLVSLEKSNYPSEHIYITVVDNNSTDGTRELLKHYTGKQHFGGFRVYLMDRNLGFGAANNYGVKQTKESFILFLNVDTEVEPDAINNLLLAADASDDSVALWEARQFPYEHPKIYNPVTMETSWSSAAACLVRRDYFEKAGGFDENIFMYAEDVDLSWRLRANGYKTVYVPDSVVYHYSYQKAFEIKPSQFYNVIFNNLMLRYKFGNWGQITAGYLLYLLQLLKKEPFPGSRAGLLKNLPRIITKGIGFRKWKREYRQTGFKPQFVGWDFEVNRPGAFYHNVLPVEKPLVSVLVRTCGRPDVLRETLLSIQNQTYKNIEVIVVEDGSDVSRHLIETEFINLKVKYYATGTKTGRSKAGNIALELASGKYLNFLDDDDLFYAEHVEVLCTALQNNRDYKVAYALAFETPLEILSTQPYRYKEIFYKLEYREEFDRFKLLHHNYLPIQCVMFEKEVYSKLGGFDHTLEYFEDWDLWLRYASQNDFLFINKVTSKYRVPAKPSDVKVRQGKFSNYLHLIRAKHMENGSMSGLTIDELDARYRQPKSLIYKLRKNPSRVLLAKFKYRAKNLFYRHSR